MFLLLLGEKFYFILEEFGEFDGMIIFLIVVGNDVYYEEMLGYKS